MTFIYTAIILTTEYKDDVSPPHSTCTYPHTHLSQEVFKKGDTDQDGLINFAQFVTYIVDHEKKLELAFKTLDSNEDGEAKNGRALQDWVHVYLRPH